MKSEVKNIKIRIVIGSNSSYSMGRESEQTYFDTLCEEEQISQETHEQLHTVVEVLKELANATKSEQEQNELLHSLSKEHRKLTDICIDLRYAKYQAREAQVAASKRTKKNHSNTKLQDTKSLAEYITLCESISKDSLEYVNLLERLSVDLAKQIEIADPKVSEFIVDNWNPPKGIYAILETLGDPTVDPKDIATRIRGYLDQIKMERAKYTIQNKYSLQETLHDLTKEVNSWRKECDSMENLMFGDSSNSMKKMLQNVDSLKFRLDREKKNCAQD